MASIDLYGGAAQRVRGAYDQHLGRAASDDEVSNWLTGAYGHGNQDNLDPVLRAIETSDEAQRRRKPPAGPPPQDGTVITPGPNESVPGPGLNPKGDRSAPDMSAWNAAADRLSSAYQQYLGRAASGGEIQDWLSGTYGWGAGAGDVEKFLGAIRESGEARAYAATQTGGTSAPGGPTGGNYQSWFQQLVGGQAPSPKALEALAPTLAKYGIKLGARNARGFIDTIVLPDGSSWDVIQSATNEGGTAWQWIPAGSGGSGSGGYPGSTGIAGVSGAQVPGLQYSDPYTKLLEQLLGGRITELTQAVNDPARQQYADALQRRATALGAAEQPYQQLLDYLQKRFTELQGPGYTGAEQEVLRTQALDPIEQDRAAAKKRVTEQLSARGLTLESGVAQQALIEVDRAFDAMRAENQRVLASNELARREDRAQRATTIGGQLVDIPQARAREQLDVFDALQLLTQSVRAEEEARRREGIGYAGALADLGPQRLQLAAQIAGLGGQPSSAIQSLLGVANLGQNQQVINQNRTAGLWSGLGSIAAILASMGK